MSEVGITLKPEDTFDAAGGKLMRRIQRDCPIGAYVVIRYWEEVDETDWSTGEAVRQVRCRYHYISAPSEPVFGEAPCPQDEDS
jgi:hypothetical protein